MKKTTKYLLVGLCVSALMLAGCCGSNGNAGYEFEFTYNFENDAEGWITEFADLPADYDEGFYQLDSSWRELPSGLDGSGIYMQGDNHIADLFMFLKRKLAGLKPETTYRATFIIDIATNIPEGLVGIGGSPGESVYVKAGATTGEPLVEEDVDGWLRMNIDKGQQSNGGEDMIVLGNIALPAGEITAGGYGIKTLDSEGQSFEVVTDTDGSLWFIVGTDSGFEGLTAIYYSTSHIFLSEIL